MANKQDNAQPHTRAVNRVGQFANKKATSKTQYMADYFTRKIGNFKRDWGVSRNLTRNEAAALLGDYAVEAGSRTFQNPTSLSKITAEQAVCLRSTCILAVYLMMPQDCSTSTKAQIQMTSTGSCIMPEKSFVDSMFSVPDSH